jgi:hypothetical protein
MLAIYWLIAIGCLSGGGYLVSGHGGFLFGMGLLLWPTPWFTNSNHKKLLPQIQTEAIPASRCTKGL